MFIKIYHKITSYETNIFVSIQSLRPHGFATKHSGEAASDSENKSNFLRVSVLLCVFQGYWDRGLGNFLGSPGRHL